MNVFPKVGDVVVRPKALGLVRHVGLVVDEDRVFHNTPENGEHVSDLKAFADGERIRVVRTRPSDKRRALSRVSAQSPRSYSLFRNNCEHTLYRVLDGQSKSPQLRGWVVVWSLAAAGLVLARRFRR